MTPSFLLQIVDAQTGEVVILPAGGTLERELVQGLALAVTAKLSGGAAEREHRVKRIKAKGVGMFRTEKHVEGVIRQEWSDLEADVLTACASAVQSVVSGLKKQTRSVA